LFSSSLWRSSSLSLWFPYLWKVVPRDVGLVFFLFLGHLPSRLSEPSLPAVLTLCWRSCFRSGRNFSPSRYSFLPFRRAGLIYGLSSFFLLSFPWSGNCSLASSGLRFIIFSYAVVFFLFSMTSCFFPHGGFPWGPRAHCISALRIILPNRGAVAFLNVKLTSLPLPFFFFSRPRGPG